MHAGGSICVVVAAANDGCCGSFELAGLVSRLEIEPVLTGLAFKRCVSGTDSSDLVACLANVFGKRQALLMSG